MVLQNMNLIPEFVIYPYVYNLCFFTLCRVTFNFILTDLLPLTHYSPKLCSVQ
jgi:hypothetical protein